MADDICDEILVNILHRLPVKTLLRCTAVCKSWHSLVTSPPFISSHSNFSNQHPSFLLRRRLGYSEERYDIFSDDAASFAPISTLEFPFRSANSFFTIVGSCNGLLCLSDDRVYRTHTIILWNPSIKRSILLPKPDSIHTSYGTITHSLGFGFDPVSADYKVIRLTYADCGPPRAELYKLSTGAWRDLGFRALECFVHAKSRQAYVGRAAHWVGRRPNSHWDLILYFDMCSEVFGEMVLPRCIAKDGRSKDLMACNESLALISWNESSFCVWVMKEYGVDESWIKHSRFDLGVRPLWVMKQGGVVAVSKDGCLVLSYDGGEVEDLGSVDGSRDEEYLRSVHVDCYVESLVLFEKGSCSSDVLTREELPTLHTSDCDSSGGRDNKRSSESVYKRC